MLHQECPSRRSKTFYQQQRRWQIPMARYEDLRPSSPELNLLACMQSKLVCITVMDLDMPPSVVGMYRSVLFLETQMHVVHDVICWLCWQVVLKSQILAGGRGLGKFKNGLQGGVHIVNVDKVQELGEQMLNQVLVTKQTGPGGKPVNTLYLAAKMQLTNEMYFAILLDRSTAGPMMIGCSEGGTSIEDLAEKYPEKIIKIPVDIREGITDAQANEMVEGLQVTTDKKAAAEQIKNMYEMFTACDCTMVEVRRLASSAVYWFFCPLLLGMAATLSTIVQGWHAIFYA